MKTLQALTTLAVVALAACEAGMTAPQTEADDPDATKLAVAESTERANVYVVDQVIYFGGERLSDAEWKDLRGLAAKSHDLIVDGDQWSVALVQEVAGRTLVSVGRASSFKIDYGEPESSGVSR